MATLGLDAKTFLIGSIGSPVWTAEIGPIKDETINLEKALADVTTRQADGWRLQVGTLKDATVDMQMVYEPADAGFVALQTAFFDNTDVALGFMDSDPSVGPGTYYGLLGAFQVTGFGMPRPLEDALMVDVTLTPVLESGTSTPPSWSTVVIPDP